MSETVPLLSGKIAEPSPPTSTSPPSNSASTDTLTHRLSSDRTLCYAQYGDPNGFPLLCLHGFPSSRLEAMTLHRAALVRGIRVLSPDRPGFGGSDFDETFTVKSVVEDMAEMVKILKLKKWVVLGISGGGPYALGVARWLTKEDGLIGVGIGCGSPYWKEGGTKGMPWYSRGLWWLASVSPGLYRGLCVGIVWSARKLCDTEWAKRKMTEVIEREREKRSGTVDEEGTVEEVRLKLVRAVFEGFRQGVKPMERELRILTGYWGFACKDVPWDKVYMWHGVKDRNAPISGMRYIAGALPHAELREYDGNHGEIVKQYDDILDTLVPEEERKTVK